MNARTIRDFSISSDIWPSVDKWAAEASFRLKESTPTSRLYQRGYGLLTAPMMVGLTQQGGKVRLEAWIAANFLARLGALFLIPAEMGIESGGFKAVVPRNIARGAVNKLLERLGQSPIG